ncbi:glycosyltransferase family 4 protein [bacterium]|nr:glycosyltransferase family 4 protein [bacterium]
MNLLFLAPILPYPVEDGDRQRAYHLLKELAKMHHVHFLGFIRSPEQQAHVKYLETICASSQAVMISRREIVLNCLKAWVTLVPLNVAAFNSRRMHAAVRQIVKDKKIDGIYTYRLRMAPYARRARVGFRVLDFTDAMTRHFQNRAQIEHSLLKQFYLQHEIKRLRKYEARISHHFDASVISSEVDLGFLKHLGAAPTLEEVTNGVDTQSFSEVKILSQKPELVFVGNMAYYPNYLGLQDFCRNIWPLLKIKLPAARLTVVGKRPADFETNQHWHQPGIDFVGIVPDISVYFKKARIAIAPLQVASGRQFKVIEYFSSALPVVATRLVADNVLACDQEHCLVADTAEQFTEKCVQLYQDDALADKIRIQGRRLALEKYDWAAAAQRLKKIIATISKHRD